MQQLWDPPRDQKDFFVIFDVFWPIRLLLLSGEAIRDTYGNPILIPNNPTLDILMKMKWLITDVRMRFLRVFTDLLQSFKV